MPAAQVILTISYHDGRSKQFFWSGSFDTEAEAARACENWLYDVLRHPDFTFEGTLDVDCSDIVLPVTVKFYLRTTGRPVRFYDHASGKYTPLCRS